MTATSTPGTLGPVTAAAIFQFTWFRPGSRDFRRSGDTDWFTTLSGN